MEFMRYSICYLIELDFVKNFKRKSVFFNRFWEKCINFYKNM